MLLFLFAKCSLAISLKTNRSTASLPTVALYSVVKALVMLGNYTAISKHWKLFLLEIISPCPIVVEHWKFNRNHIFMINLACSNRYLLIHFEAQYLTLLSYWNISHKLKLLVFHILISSVICSILMNNASWPIIVYSNYN